MDNREKEESRIVGVQFSRAEAVSYIFSKGLQIQKGDCCIVNMDGEDRIAMVIQVRAYISNCSFINKSSRVLRLASEEEKRKFLKIRDKEEEACRYCAERIEFLKLPMKLVRMEFIEKGKKAVFYFRAEGRIDFRQLVKDLAKRFRVRIELKQIGVRDEAKLLQGFGPCGRPLCCLLFLKNFEPVSIKMAKAQNLILNPAKISGLCGRLMCCLAFEHNEGENNSD